MNFTQILIVACWLIESFFCQGETTKCNEDATSDMALILDTSASISKSKWPVIVQFAHDFVEALPIGLDKVRVGVIQFADNATLKWDLDDATDKAALQEKIDDLKYDYGDTNTASALYMAHAQMFTAEHGDRPDVHNIVVIFTDGASSYNSTGTVPEAENLRKLGIEVFVIAAGNKRRFNENELKAMATDEEHLLRVESVSKISTIVEYLKQQTCKAIAVTQPPPTTTTTTTTTLAPTTTTTTKTPAPTTTTTTTPAPTTTTTPAPTTTTTTTPAPTTTTTTTPAPTTTTTTTPAPTTTTTTTPAPTTTTTPPPTTTTTTTPAPTTTTTTPAPTTTTTTTLAPTTTTTAPPPPPPPPTTTTAAPTEPVPQPEIPTTTPSAMPNPCASAPCLHSGTCLAEGSDYRCQCVACFTGKNCQDKASPPNPCKSQPCQNGGTCEERESGYVCKCLDCFTGKHCEQLTKTANELATQQSVFCEGEITICEFESRWLECPYGQTVNVKKIMFGRLDTQTCTRAAPAFLKNTSCTGDQFRAKQIANKNCEGKNRCNIRAHKSEFGDSCPDTTKYVKLCYICA